jgi:zinc protease
MRRMAEQGPTEEELRQAKSYLASSFALGLDTSSKIAAQLVQMQVDDLGIDYLERRARLIEAVTLDDAKRVARRLLAGGLLITVAGRPVGLAPTSTAAGGQDGSLTPVRVPASRDNTPGR